MSLQVWLPLNGNIENLGICGDVTSTSTPEYTVGKLEKGISLNKRVDFTGLPKLTNFSIFFWARVDSCTTTWSDLRVNNLMMLVRQNLNLKQRLKQERVRGIIILHLEFQVGHEF